MPATLGVKGQVAIPKQTRLAPQLTPGCSVECAINAEGKEMLHKHGARPSREPARYEQTRNISAYVNQSLSAANRTVRFGSK